MNQVKQIPAKIMGGITLTVLSLTHINPASALDFGFLFSNTLGNVNGSDNFILATHLCDGVDRWDDPDYYDHCLRTRGWEGHEPQQQPRGTTTENEVIKYNNRAMAREDQGDYRGAMEDFNTAIALDRNYALSYNNRGSLKEYKLNDLNGALADYNKAIALAPNFAIAYVNRCSLKQYKLNDLNGALADCNRAIALDRNVAEAYVHRGSLKHKLNDPNGSLADFNWAITLDRNHAMAYYNRGYLKALINDPNGAIKDFRTAAKIFRQQGNVNGANRAINHLREMGATE